MLPGSGFESLERALNSEMAPPEVSAAQAAALAQKLSVLCKSMFSLKDGNSSSHRHGCGGVRGISLPDGSASTESPRK